MSTWVVVPDLQVPLHDQRFVDATCDWIANNDFDGLLNVGDECDMTTVGRWVKGRKGEFIGNLQKDLDLTNRILGQYREALGDGKPYHLMRSNHTQRLESYLGTNAPALEALKCLDYPTLVGLDDYDITFHREPYQFEKGWWLAHGDEGGSSSVPGSVAMGLARRFQGSVICGHTHKAAIQHAHGVVAGAVRRRIYGVETGHGMDLKKASYLPGGSGNWQQALTVISDGVPTLLLVNNGKVAGGYV